MDVGYDVSDQMRNVNKFLYHKETKYPANNTGKFLYDNICE